MSSKFLSHDCSDNMPINPSKPPAYFIIFFILFFCLGNYNLMDRLRPYDLVRGNPIDSKPCALLLVKLCSGSKFLVSLYKMNRLRATNEMLAAWIFANFILLTGML